MTAASENGRLGDHTGVSRRQISWARAPEHATNTPVIGGTLVQASEGESRLGSSSPGSAEHGGATSQTPEGGTRVFRDPVCQQARCYIARQSCLVCFHAAEGGMAGGPSAMRAPSLLQTPSGRPIRHVQCQLVTHQRPMGFAATGRRFRLQMPHHRV